jgi:hypothetical protein
MSTNPQDIELEAACCLIKRQARDILSRDESLLDRISGDEINFRFHQNDLLHYLQQRPALCEQILDFSYDKRYSPSTFMEEHEGSYRVGWYEDGRQQMKTFDNIFEAATDFVLFSWHLGRFERKENEPG